MYVKVLSKDKGAGKVSPSPGGHVHHAGEEQDEHDAHDHAEIAPATAEQLRKVQTSYRIYSIIFPVYWLISQLDHLLFFDDGYCVIVDGRRRH
jgi:hypothetical protein